MKKRIISGLLTLCIIASMFAVLMPVSQIKANAATASQQNIVDRANYMYNATWVCQKTVTGWGGTFYAGSTYHVPYGQPIYSGSYVGFRNGSTVDDSTIDTYLAAAADPNSIFYSGRSYYTGKQAPYYSNDCSAFVSWCWGVSRKTTASIPNVSTNLGMATASNNYNLQIGDALNSNSAGHVVLVTGLSYNEWGSITSIEITEQTPPQLKKSYYTPESLGSKYGGRYSIQRYYGEVPAAPNSQPVGTSPMGNFDEATGGIGSFTVRGWAVDPDETGKSLDLYVSIGGPVFTAGAEGTVINSDAYREDVNNAHGCGGNHGFQRTIGTRLTGWQEVYVYAYDNDGNAEATFLGNKTVYITPDTEAPVLGEVVVFSSDNNKYTVACAVSDNGYLSRVSFPTWTEENPDNKIWYDGFVFGGVAYCDIPIADFNNYNGRYHTHCYAYDSAGNQAANGNFSTTFNNPIGCVDGLDEADGIIRIRGWAFDRDAVDEAASVHVYIGEPGSDYYEGHNITADLERLDVDAANNCGPNHGFDVQLTTTMSGTQPVYIYAINKGNGGNVLLEKREITISSEGVPPSIANPQVISSDGESFTVSCEVTDNRRVSSVSMAVWPENNHDAIKWYDASIDNNTATARIPVADFGDYNGKYEVHIYAYDYNNNSIGYPYSTTFNKPVGSLDYVSESDGKIRIRGWALDKDAIDEAVEIHAYIGSPEWIHVGYSGIMANLTRDDVAAALNCDPNHGFETEINASFMSGTQDILVYAINKGNGGNVLLGKQTITISPDTVKPEVHSANISKSDASGFTVECQVSDDRAVKEVNMAVWPENNQDAMKWYSTTVEYNTAAVTIPVADFDNYNGKYIVHIYAKDYNNNESGFAYETTFNMPIGSFDLIEDKTGAIRVQGCAIDSDDLNETLYVDVYIGAPAGDPNADPHRIKADDVRSFPDDFFGIENGKHGYDTVLLTNKRGEQTVYVYAINIGNGDNTYLGCKTVTISDPLVGDADGNGDINITDVTTIQRHIAQIESIADTNLAAADVNKDGIISIIDATLIQQFIAQIIPSL